ncbi:superfamily II DNA/RNA helicase [Alkalihalobacillus xiaoxiensis]|uniref:Superfamily II DNA/RNA helicase n=1 Tax=Shouchella xiaoxiensis TaxID=766895 RepID=A0ABS2SS54_9BACI|nr:DEAD/DEAH box helicase [Shouchella xiaoxiensis]MBM7838327.1 superfamily II DNA/RNA helicase [Shouchella xiaoxiensis]
MITHFTMGTWPNEIEANLSKAGIQTPTPIQKTAIPAALEGKNILLRSQTGSGKTLAYTLPLLASIDSEKLTTQALIIAPSQELAVQIEQVIKETIANTGITCQTFIGGANINRQIEKLKKKKPHIAVGTPGRVLELVKTKKIKLADVGFYVIDEVDRLVLEDKSWSEVEELGKRIGYSAQFMFASATAPDKLETKLASFVKDIVRIEADGSVVPAQVEHVFVMIEARDRIDMVRRLIHAEGIKKGIVFVNQLDKLTEAVEKLRYRKIDAVGLSSESSKQERELAIQAMKSNEASILVATDVAARGLDLADVTHIIQLETPNEAASYLHRAGRTGRMNQSGKVISLFERRELYKKEKYENHLSISIEPVELAKGRLISKQY